MSTEMVPHIIYNGYIMGNIEVACAKLQVIFKFYQKIELISQVLHSIRFEILNFTQNIYLSAF